MLIEYRYIDLAYIYYITKRLLIKLKINFEILSLNFKKSYFSQFLKFLKNLNGLIVPLTCTIQNKNQRIFTEHFANHY